MSNLVLMSHGNMAQEVYNSAKMILGDAIQAQTVCMEASDGLQGTKEKLDTVLSDLDSKAPTLIIADLKGGTPANVASLVAASSNNLKVITGLNLSLVIEAAMSSADLENETMKNLIKTGKDSIEEVSIVLTDDLDDE